MASGSSKCSPILVQSDSDSDVPVVSRSSPLKVIKSNLFRHVIQVLDSPELVKREPSDDDSKTYHEAMICCKRLKFSMNDEIDDDGPMYEVPPPKYSADRILQILLDPAIPCTKICSRRPTVISRSATFVVDITKLEDPNDVKQDNFGAWEHSGSHPRLFKVNVKDDGFISIDKCAPGASGDDVVYLRRLHSVHPSNKQFKRMLAFVSDAANNPHHLCLVTYRIPQGFVPIVKKHGNSKADVPFHPTWPSTKKKILCSQEGPKAVIASISTSVGGVRAASAPGQLPRSEKQVVNIKARGSSLATCSRNVVADDLFSVMQQAYTQDPENKFIRAVNAAPQPAILLATDKQLHDLVRFCTSAFEFSILTVDPTFSLGDFDVTLVTYRHLLLNSKRYKAPPVCVGPICIHYKKTFETYVFFASSMIGQCRQLEAVRAIGTDGERALIDAFKHEFGFSQHLTCSLHVRRNIKGKLHEFKLPSQLCDDILSDIFGKKIGGVYVEGLVDAKDSSDFEAMLDKATENWRCFEDTEPKGMDQFLSWFVKYKVPVIRDTMLSQVRQECGLGCPPDKFTTNACETANSMLKNKVHYKRSELYDFIGKLKEFVEEQENEIERAIIGRGKYLLRSQYSFLQVPETKWFAMNTTQRMQHIEKVSSLTLADVDKKGCSSSTVLHYSKDPDMVGALTLGVDVLSGTAKLPQNVLEGIWNKAAELLKTKDAIVPAPGMGPSAKFVMSYSGKRPHLVTQKKGGAFTCDADCANWKGLGICSHSLAVAELFGQLAEFIAWYKRAKKIPNLTKFAEATMPKGRGRKGTAPPRKRKTSLNLETRVENPAIGLSASYTQQPDMASFAPPWHTSQNAIAPVISNTNTINLSPQSSTGFAPTPPQSSWSSPFSAGPSIPTPFTLCIISGNISVCAGCRNKYSKQPLPPDDLCIRHQEWREYMNPTSSTPQSRFGNVYYHFYPSCVRYRIWDFMPSMLYIPPELLTQLTPVHKHHLLAYFQIHLP